MSDTEVWKPVPSEPWYEASSLGRVRRIGGPETNRWKLPRDVSINARGWGKHSKYVSAMILRPNGRITRVVHRLVAEAFLGPAPSPDYEIDHINGNKADNRVENLEWVTRSENVSRAYALGAQRHIGEANGRAKVTEKDVRTIRERFARGATRAALAREYGVDWANIEAIVTRRAWSHVQ